MKYTEKRFHTIEQDTIAQIAGPLQAGLLAHWSVTHTIPMDGCTSAAIPVQVLTTASRTHSPAVSSPDAAVTMSFDEVTVIRPPSGIA